MKSKYCEQLNSKNSNARRLTVIHILNCSRTTQTSHKYLISEKRNAISKNSLFIFQITSYNYSFISDRHNLSQRNERMKRRRERGWVELNQDMFQSTDREKKSKRIKYDINIIVSYYDTIILLEWWEKLHFERSTISKWSLFHSCFPLFSIGESVRVKIEIRQFS